MFRASGPALTLADKVENPGRDRQFDAAICFCLLVLRPSLGTVTASGRATAGYEVQNQGNDGDDQKQVNEPAGYVESCPGHYPSDEQ